ncbi:hypothetical protein MWU58_03075 [Flavobacteriaceae bacterium S0825]|uniref:DUF4175 family protein n=1 Tax=Gaetbulibacter sp. S0825 TaxID=2720084 RepID=UPI00143218D9|nr:DUF4175 family protein [Gaetbulibacter sp. S0825]MCK0108260.1 hypothetical protein [Flavobacteriaceae bacterium S0825]NIX63896.1 hypothetical protein [Gaetbulibacter sp. S0825]
MSNFNNIQNKLEAFIKKYYTNELIKGTILFFAIGLLYFLITLSIEYALWLSPIGRTVLFWVFVIVELALFIRFILKPISKLFKFQKGIDYLDASKIIGNHFPEVNDKLVNVLQLKENSKESELLLASIEQKAIELNPIPFKLAINFKSNVKYLKYAAIPLLIILLSFISGKYDWFSDSYERVINYKTAYEPPAPFQFFVVNDSLKALENDDFTLVVQTEGEVIPDNVQISYNNETYYLKQINPGVFEYIFAQPKEAINFHLLANEVVSRDYNLEVINTPILLSFDLVLDYPTYTKKQDEILKSNGNAIVPQGTKVIWNLKTKSTENVVLSTPDSLVKFNGENDVFQLSKRLYKSLDYSLHTSNKSLKDYESLAFSINVIRDQYPELNVKMEQDSTDSQTLYFYGQVSDDYGLSKLQLVYYPSNSEDDKKTEKLTVSSSNFDEFVSVFPNQLNLEEGVSYDLYFEVFDNDAISNYKSTKSNAFSYRKLTKDEVEQEQLKEQSETIDDLNNSLEKLEEQDEELKEFSKTQKEKSELNFNDKKKLENFLKRQKEQDELMKNFNKQLKENLQEFQEDKEDPFKESLKQRLEENQEQLKKDEELLKELEKLSEKIQKEELSQKLEELAKQNKNKKRSLQQLLELTKRYYVTMKSEKIRVELEELAKEQEKLSEESEENNTKEKQNELNKKFEDIQKELEDLRKENDKLREPLDVPNDKKKEEDIKKEQQEASENLEKKEESQDQQNKEQQQNNAKKSQKKAAQKMKQMSEQMQQSMMSGGAEQMSEDIDMLRQVLDNLVLYSFDQENVMDKFKSIQVNHNEYAKYLIKQQSLREHFEHIDDSLFALSLRQPTLSESINKEITEVFFNIDKSLEQLAENRLYQGVAAQQYAVTSANSLASLLSDILDNMENQMNPSPGQGQGGDMQLPDIIMSQEELNKQMEEGLKKSEEGQKKEGEKGKEGQEGEQKEGEGEQQGEGEGGNSEELNGELFRIYQQQQQLRQALEDKLGKEGKKGAGGNLLREMESIENDLLNRGFTNRTLQRMMNLQHQLLKLENATFQQGEDNKRKSKTNQQQFNNLTNTQLQNAKQYFNTTEILNRQALPLQQVYKKKVQEYFKKTND